MVDSWTAKKDNAQQSVNGLTDARIDATTFAKTKHRWRKVAHSPGHWSVYPLPAGSRPCAESLRTWLIGALICLAFCLSTQGQTRVEDIFGRSLNQHGITLTDRDGYIANPLIKFVVLPPTNAPVPGSARLTANGARLYFESAGEVSTNGPGKTVSLAGPAARETVSLSIFPDRDGLDEDYTLTMVFTDANSGKQTNTVPIHVIDQDLPRTNDFVVTVNFDRDVTGFFANATRRALVKQAAEDWGYFFGGMNLDVVTVGTESTYIWSNNFNGGYYVNNTNSYRGYQLYAYGTTNSAHRSGGEASYSGPVQRSNGVALTIKRSGGFEAEIYGNYNTRGWLLLTNDDDWLVTGNLGHETNDFYSIAHHEIGHALMFNPAHSGFNAAKAAGAFRSAAVTNYFGGPVAIDSFDHLNGTIDPESGQGVFGYEYYGRIPRKRWIPTKLDLLCAQEVGYALRSSSAFAALTLGTQPVAAATATVPFSFAFNASGGIPFYDWTIVAGALPPGVVLDPFTGALSGTPATEGTFTFSLRLRDYRENSGGVTNVFTMTVAPPPPFSLDLSLGGLGTDRHAQVSLFGTTGQRQVVEISSNLEHWMPLATNLTATNDFRLMETNLSQYPLRFYRAVIRP